MLMKINLKFKYRFGFAFTTVFACCFLFVSFCSASDNDTLAPVSSLKSFEKELQNVQNRNTVIGIENIYQNIFDQYVEKQGMRYFSIDGLSSVGKTTFTYNMAQYFKNKGYNPVIIHLDNYNPFGVKKMEKITNRIRRILYSVIKSKGIKIFTTFDFAKIFNVIDRLAEIKASKKDDILEEQYLTVIYNNKDFGSTDNVLIDDKTVVLFEGTFVARQLARFPLIDKFIMLRSDVERQMKSHKARTLQGIKRSLNPSSKNFLKEIGANILRYFWYPAIYSNFFAPHYYQVYRPYVDKYTDMEIDNTDFAYPVMNVRQRQNVSLDIDKNTLPPHKNSHLLVSQAV